MVNQDLNNTLSRCDAEPTTAWKQTIISAPLSHISLTKAFLDRGVGKDDSIKADNAMTFFPSVRRILLISWNDFCHVAFIAPKSIPTTQLIGTNTE